MRMRMSTSLRIIMTFRMSNCAFLFLVYSILLNRTCKYLAVEIVEYVQPFIEVCAYMRMKDKY